MITPEQIAKLPKWAQQHIAVLESNVAYWKKIATAGPAESDTFAGNSPRYEFSRSDNPPRPLGMGERVYFHLNGSHDLSKGGMVEAHIDQQGRLLVSADDYIVVIPQASNSIHIVSERR